MKNWLKISLFQIHNLYRYYAGDADGPVTPFGFEMGPFGVEAEYLRFHCPERTARLTQVLDYFHGMKSAVAQDHMIFRWEQNANFGDGGALQVDFSFPIAWKAPGFNL